MVRLGKVYENMMVDLQRTSEKLVERGIRTVMMVTGVEYGEAEAVLRGAGGRVSDCRGRPLRYGKDDPAQLGGIFAARPDAWEKARDVVRELAPGEEPPAGGGGA